MSRNWCFTLNNYTEEEYNVVLCLESRYLCVGREVGEVEGTPHLQGYIVFSQVRSMKAVSKDLPRAYLAIAHGDSLVNFNYCSKGGSFVEKGQRPLTQKEKGDSNSERWDSARKAAEEGRWEDVPSDIYIAHVHKLEYIHSKKQKLLPINDGELENEWIWGPPGCGKTSSVFAAYPDAYLKDLTQWWDGYDGQEVVIIDDMDSFHKGLARMFKLAGDRYPFPVQIKGGQKVIRPKKIVVTSQYNIREIWDDEATRQAMDRRFVLKYLGVTSGEKVQPIAPNYAPGFFPYQK